MKFILPLLLILCVPLMGCGSKKNESSSKVKAQPTASVEVETETAPNEVQESKPLTPVEKVVGTYSHQYGNGIKQIFKFNQDGTFNYFNINPAPFIGTTEKAGRWKLYNRQHIVFSTGIGFGETRTGPPKFFRIETDGSLTTAGELVNGVAVPPVMTNNYIKQ